ncbi:hypothetical protein DFQ27_008496 [Actinomortierella ambigua]|uniref:Mannose-P-dolichol utilization defect 1 protein homolog n=1 Tax=Actinomortierella ambigua TaxID=1343610 RepID=A0A9P6PTQ3_9FUNG|nr:hypothetical protein DFQ27_008496 [Actinomortierella ambigua]
MQLPYVLKAPATAIIGEKCYSALIEDLDYKNVPCIKYSISKGLGMGIVLGGAIVKVPQIIKIVAAHSAEGVSFTSYMLETLASVISLAYNVRQNNPLSTYGETFFVTIQNLIILGLMMLYSKRQLSGFIIISSFLFLGKLLAQTSSMTHLDGSVVTSTLVPAGAMAVLQAATIPINLASKVPQIIENYRNGSTGQLSAFTVFNYFAGSLARVYTTMTEVDDMIILAGFLLSTLFNCILALQMALYWNATPPAKAGKGKKAGDSLPVSSSSSAAQGKKKSKKLD